MGSGDGIQHGVFREPVSFPHVSASIRYSAPEYWIVLRGEWLGKKDGAGAAQYPAEAQLLVDKPEYCGEAFSYGDKFLAVKARDGAHPGNPTQWLLAGINHHITLTTQMVRGLRLQTRTERATANESLFETQ